MWGKRKLLLAAIIFTALYCKVTTKEAVLLDMAPGAVDDLYKGCREAALNKFVHSGLLKQELNQSQEFREAWSSNTKCSKQILGGTKEHSAALLAYATDNTAFQKTFDNAVRTMGANISMYDNHFHFKSLHFLLMDSISLLNPKNCTTVYALREEHTAKKGSTVRFGQFAVVHSRFDELQKMTDLDGLVLLNITSCFFANLKSYTCSNEDIALVSPVEEFTVEGITKITDSNDAEYTEIVLKHSKLESFHNCYSVSRSPAVASTLWLVLVLVAFSLLFFNC